MHWQRKLVACFAALMVAGWGNASLSLAAAQAERYTGYFAIIWGDGVAGSGLTAETYWLDDGADLHLRLDMEPELAQPWGGLAALNGRRVTVTGTRTGVSAQGGEASELVVQSLEPAAGLGAADLGTQAVTGHQPWVSILCNFPDRTPASPKSLSFFQGMYGNSYPALDHYWRELSYNNVDVVGSGAFGWYTLPQPWAYYVPSGHLDFDRAANDCTAKADANVYFPSYVGINLMFNAELDGYAWGGGEVLNRDGMSKYYRMTWEPPWGWGSIGVIEHEMGHGFGLPHSSGMYGATYDNYWDVMSNTWIDPSRDPTYGAKGQHTIAPYKDQLGWISAGKKVTLPYKGQVTLTLEQLAQPQTGGPLLARIPTCDSSRFYSVEARRKVGYDSILPGEGVIIHKVQSGTAYVVDRDLVAPTSNANLTPSVTYASKTATESFTLTVGSATSTGYVVTITNTAPCEPPNPPTLLAPADGSSVQQRRVGFFWQPSASPNQSYLTLQVDTFPYSNGSPWLLSTSVFLPTTAYTYTFAADGKYYWHVRST